MAAASQAVGAATRRAAVAARGVYGTASSATASGRRGLASGPGARERELLADSGPLNKFKEKQDLRKRLDFWGNIIYAGCAAGLLAELAYKWKLVPGWQPAASAKS
eukprot:jgi/Chlat1/8056/Chrsp73S07524